MRHARTCPHLYCPFDCHTGLQEAHQVETGWGELYLVRLGEESRKQAVADNVVRSQQEKNNHTIARLYIRTDVPTYVYIRTYIHTVHTYEYVQCIHAATYVRTYAQYTNRCGHTSFTTCTYVQYMNMQCFELYSCYTTMNCEEARSKHLCVARLLSSTHKRL